MKASHSFTISKMERAPPELLPATPAPTGEMAPPPYLADLGAPAHVGGSPVGPAFAVGVDVPQHQPLCQVPGKVWGGLRRKANAF